jgi:23S rRNA (uracil1939-C5)-methyltransferase
VASLRALLRPEYALGGVTVRCAPATGEVLAILLGDQPADELARAWMERDSTLVGILQRRGRQTTLLCGRDFLVQELGGVRWQVSAGSFFQINDRQTARLIQRVCHLIDPTPGERILDLFCGVGTFALPLAKRHAFVTGVESYRPAIDDARRSATLNKIGNTRWLAGPVEAMLEKLRPPWNAAVVDPPRRGCAPATLDHLLRLRPERIVYVACHPGTLARDCKVLCAGGYHAERAEVIDLFPQTHHVESIVVLRRTTQPDAPQA